MYKKKEMKQYKNDLEFQWVYQGFKNKFWFRLKSTYRVLFRELRINNINSMLKTDV